MKTLLLIAVSALLLPAQESVADHMARTLAGIEPQLAEMRALSAYSVCRRHRHWFQIWKRHCK